jgi:hypothetical protein
LPEKLKKLELVTEYSTSKGVCELAHPKWTEDHKYHVAILSEGTRMIKEHESFDLRASAMEYIRSHLK